MIVMMMPAPDYITTCCGTRKIIEVPNETSSDTIFLCGKCAELAFVTDCNELDGIRRTAEILDQMTEDRKQYLLEQEQYEEIDAEMKSQERFRKRMDRLISLIEKAKEDPSI